MRLILAACKPRNVISGVSVDRSLLVFYTKGVARTWRSRLSCDRPLKPWSTICSPSKSRLEVC